MLNQCYFTPKAVVIHLDSILYGKIIDFDSKISHRQFVCPSTSALKDALLLHFICVEKEWTSDKQVYISQKTNRMTLLNKGYRHGLPNSITQQIKQ